MPDVKWYSSSTGTTFSVDITPTAADGAAVGTAALPWSDLFLAAGGVINWSAGEITVTHTTGATPYLRLAGGNLRVATAFMPVNSDGAALGSTETMWSDAFFASGAVLNFDNGDVTLTHSANTLTLGGGNLAMGANSITFDGPATWRGQNFALTAQAENIDIGAFIATGATTAGLQLAAASQLSWAPSTVVGFSTASDTGFRRNAAGVVEINNGTAGTRADLRVAGIYAASAYASVGPVAIAHASGYLEIMEQSAPAAGQRSSGRLFLVDNAGGKRALQIQFGTGSAVTIATEP